MAGTLLFQLICLLPLIIILTTTSANQESLGDRVVNVSVPLGSKTSLICPLSEQSSLQSQTPLKVSWVRQGDDTVLSINNEIITRNHRLKVTTDHLTYSSLHIREVKESDRGCYSCKVNTTPNSSQITCIDVLVSPDIEETSVDMTVDEGQDTTLICKARGHPQPTIYWKREDNQLMNHGETMTGSVLRLTQIRREHSGAYLCIATNNVPPAVSKRIYLTVNYSPEVHVEESRVGCEEGKDVRLVCNCFASPRPKVIWLFNHVLISHSHKYSLDREESEGVVSSGLRLRSVGSSDFGYYTCDCSNSLGRRVSSLLLYRISGPTSMPETVITGNQDFLQPGSISEDDVAVTEIDDNSLGSMTSAKATSIRVTVLESFLGHSSHHHHDASSSTRIFASFIFILVISLLIF